MSKGPEINSVIATMLPDWHQSLISTTKQIPTSLKWFLAQIQAII